MVVSLEYPVSVRHSLPASVALFSLTAMTLFLASNAGAQTNTPTASVTSSGVVGHAVNPPTGVTPSGLVGRSVNPPTGVVPRGPGPNSRTTFLAPNIGGRNVPHDGEGRHHRHHDAEYGPTLLYGVPVPYTADDGANDEVDADTGTDDEYLGGPTIFDRRGSGASSYIPPIKMSRPSILRRSMPKSARIRPSLRLCSCSKMDAGWRSGTTPSSGRRFSI